MNSQYPLYLLALVGSFVPIYIAAMRGHKQEHAIFALNAVSVVVAFGITPEAGSILRFDPSPAIGALGWIAALLWSVSKRAEAVIESKFQ